MLKRVAGAHKSCLLDSFLTSIHNIYFILQNKKSIPKLYQLPLSVFMRGRLNIPTDFSVPDVVITTCRGARPVCVGTKLKAVLCAINLHG